MVREINIWLNSNPYKNKRQAKPYSDAILQQLLKNSLNTSQPLNIKKNSNGKPFVDEPVFFSHSNCRQLHAYVIATDHEVGIDVEYINKKRPIMQLASRYFHTQERDLLASLPAEKRSQVFFKQWTRKEAWCKLEGGNLWSYLNKQPSDVSEMYFCESTQVDGFAIALASPKNIDKIRINSIGNP